MQQLLVCYLHLLKFMLSSVDSAEEKYVFSIVREEMLVLLLFMSHTESG